MTDYLLDTNHLSPLVTLTHSLRRRIFHEQRRGNTFAIALPSVTEFLFGIGLLPRAEQNLSEWEHLQELLTIYNLGMDDAQFAAELQISLRKKGWQLDTVDALIAATAIQHNLVLLTTDKDFRAIPQLPQENWLTS